MSRQTTRTRTQKRWDDITKHDLVELGDDLYNVVKVKPLDNGKVKVTVRDSGGNEFSSKMVGKYGVDVIELVTRKEKRWSKPDDQAEANIVDGLGAVILGVKPSATECYIVPLVDPSTIASHLYLFHAITPPNVKEPGGYDEAVALHDADHEAKALADLFEPHIHEAKRPVTEIGPRFQ